MLFIFAIEFKKKKKKINDQKVSNLMLRKNASSQWIWKFERKNGQTSPPQPTTTTAPPEKKMERERERKKNINYNQTEKLLNELYLSAPTTNSILFM